MSTSSTPARGRKAALSLAVAGAVVGGLLSGTPASAAPDQGAPETRTQGKRLDAGRYIVVLREPAAAQFDGGNGFARTRVTGNGQFDSQSQAVKDYASYLRSTHRRMAGQVGAAIEADYTMALNGFAADLTAEQASTLANDRRVLSVAPERIVKMQTWNTPDFLGMSGEDGVWSKYGGQKTAGEGVVVGVLDTGIWPESKSFKGAALTGTDQGKWDARMVGSTTYMDKRDGTRFQGACETGEDFELSDCSTKIIGARYYDSYFDSIPEELRTDYRSPRDGGGHGSHTAGTAAGKAGVQATVEGRDFGKISGMAPGAAIAVYKVLWESSDDNWDGGSNVDIVHAIDDAVADGVDVINYSIGGGVESGVDDPTLMAFEGAAEAGIFNATSASNNGPDAETVEKAVPWMTSVAATTHRAFENTVVLGNGKKYVGASIAGTPVSSSPLVDSVTAAPDGASEDEVADAQLCGPETLDESKVAGAIVICTRGGYDRVAKSAEVARAGGDGMILVNPGPNSLDADFHSVPTVHVDDVSGAKIKEYAATSGATAAIKLGNLTNQQTPVPQIAEFSGRGPASMVEGDMIKPDIAAPGVSVLAAVAPPSNSERDFDLYSGTSMASPHIAGLAAFMMSERPSMTAMQVKSAMMTTAKDLFGPDGKPVADPFAQGAGFIVPKKMFNPGLYVVSDKAEWQSWMANQGIETGYRPIETTEINQPSMAEGGAVGPVTFTRELTAAKVGTWKVSVNVPGFSATHTKQIVTDRKGDVEDLKVTFTRTTAAFNEYSTGFVKLTGPTTVRMPVALQPVAVDAPEEVTGEGTSGEKEIEITPGFTGELDLTATGLEQAETHEGSVETTEDAYYDDYCVTVEEGAKVLRANLDTVSEDADLDLFLHSLEGDCSSDVAEFYYFSAATPASDEVLTWVDPEPGSYLVSVELFAPSPGSNSEDYVLDIFNVDSSSNAGAFTVDPDPVPVTEGQETSFVAEWTGLAPGTKYFGMIEYEDGLHPTFLTVDTSSEPAP